MNRCATIVCVLACISAAAAQCPSGFRLANYYANDMVLQRPPVRPKIWGFGSAVGEQVIVNLNSGSQTKVTNSVLAPDGQTVVWEVALDPISTAGPHSFSVQTGATCVITISNILIGDVWLCSGQSNMEMRLNEIDEPQPDIDDAVNYPNVRTLQIANVNTNTPQLDATIQRNWAVPNAGNIAGYSALCWLFGRNLFRRYGQPVGLIQSDWGGTRVEAWSSPEALDVCFTTVPPGSGANEASALFNGMINPLLKFPIFGAIWYQGESNTGNWQDYACAIKAMVADWRAKWNSNSAEMDDTFPFGQVSLAPWNNNESGFRDIRWAQTDSLGYTPHSTMQKFFLAIAIDLPDFNSPSGDIHPRYKRQIADRLSLAAFNVAYNTAGTGIFQGPIPTAYARDGNNIRVTYPVPLQFRDTSNIFEVCCGAAASNTCSAGGQWVVASFVQGGTQDITISNPCGGSESVTGFRYLWRQSPCPLEQCPVYSVENNLPAPPYTIDVVIT